MKTSLLDFIDSDTLREHLRNQALEPAIECILIVHCRNCSIEKKLEALKERYDTYSKEDFNKGTYYCREIDLKSVLKEYIDSTEKVLDDMYRPDNNHVFSAHATDNIGFHGTFNTFEAAIDLLHRLLLTFFYPLPVNAKDRVIDEVHQQSLLIFRQCAIFL